MKDPVLGPSIEVSQEGAIEELEDIPVEKNTQEDPHRTLATPPPPASVSAVWHTSVKRQHSHKNLKLRVLHQRIK